MSKTTRRLRSALLTGASTALIASLGTTAAYADEPIVDTEGQVTISHTQDLGEFSTTLDSTTEGSVSAEINSDDDDVFALQNSTVSVGTAGNGNSSTATGFGNSADLAIAADLNNVTGTGLANVTASSNSATDGASVTGAKDIGIALSQQADVTAASVSDDTNLTIALDNGATASTAEVVSNTHGATGVLNIATNAIDTAANNSSGSASIGLAQASVDSTLTASVTSVDGFSTGAGPDGVALNNSTVRLTGNSQTATGVANSGSNAQSVAGNSLELADVASGQASAGGNSATAIGGYVTASRQELAGVEADTGVAAIVDGGYSASITGDIAGSTLRNDSNSATALARANEAVNTTTIDGNSGTTNGDSGTAAAIASQQAINGDVDIVALVTGDETNGPVVSNAITGDVTGSSRVTASGNSLEANAAGNRDSNSIAASATTIDTSGDEGGSATNVANVAGANAGFAVANNQTVSFGTTITAGLVDAADVDDVTRGASVLTAISGSVANSRVESNSNELIASATGNETLTGGNSISLDGTNVATNAAVSSVQSMNGAINALIGSGGIAPVPSTPFDFTFTGSSTGGTGNWTFTGSTSGSFEEYENLAALNTNPNLEYSWDAADGGTISLVASNQVNSQTTFETGYEIGGSPGSPASGGVMVTVGNDITDSAVTVNGNTTSGTVAGNSATNRISADATNLDGGSTVTAASAATTETGIAATADLAVANTQSVGATAALASSVGGIFGISAEGVTVPDLSDVESSTLSVSGNTLESTATGNSAANSVQQSATNLANTSAVANSQQMNGSITADVVLTTDNPDEPALSGAFAVIGRDVTDSSVVVDGNTFAGAVTGNDATNRVIAAGTSSLASGDGTSGAVADPALAVEVDDDIFEDHAVAQADQSLLNVQGLGVANLQTSVDAGYGITTLGTGDGGLGSSDVEGSTLSVSDNVQTASTTGNSALNQVGISGGNIATNGALLSVQEALGVTADADSTMSVGAPAANLNSSLSLDGNANSATSTLNTATNTMAVTADTHLASTTVGGGVPATEGDNADLSGSAVGNYVAQADFVVNNVQTVTLGAVSATAETNILNNDRDPDTAFATDGIQQSTVAINGNSTQASATSNRSVNSLTLSANSASASAGVLNQQVNGASVQADATSLIGVDVASAAGSPAPSPVNNSAVSVSGNGTVARAGGNSATNSLSAAATSFANNGAAEGTPGAILNGIGGDTVQASYAVLNEQANSGPITATATVTYGASFENLGTSPSITNAAVTVNGNSAGSVAYGNAVTNQVTFAALNSPAAPGTVPTTTAVASNQLNTGNVSATTTAQAVGISSGYAGVGVGSAGVVQSGLSINGNTLSSAAYGNSATSTLTISGNNVNVAPALIP